MSESKLALRALQENSFANLSSSRIAAAFLLAAHDVGHHMVHTAAAEYPWSS